MTAPVNPPPTGDRVYIVFELDPAVEIQDGFTFVVSELHLCSRTTAARNCSNQHTIVTVRGSLANIFVFMLHDKSMTHELYFLRALPRKQVLLMCVWR